MGIKCSVAGQASVSTIWLSEEPRCRRPPRRAEREAGASAVLCGQKGEHTMCQASSQTLYVLSLTYC